MSLIQTGVYCWYNRVNKKRYVGSAARSLSGRRVDHLSELRRGKSPCIYLQRAFTKYGEGVFEFRVLERCPPETCLTREQYWIDFYASSNSQYGYNCNPIAGSPLGRRWKRKTPRPPVSEETRQKLSAVWKGRKHTEETKAKMRLSGLGKNAGRILTPEHKAKLREASLRRVHSEETKAKISASNLGKNKGKKMPKSSETRQRISEAAKARWARRLINE